ncbi:MAG: HNH endonuclease signature motif containing protein [Minisyncoccia bacterium]
MYNNPKILAATLRKIFEISRYSSYFSLRLAQNFGILCTRVNWGWYNKLEILQVHHKDRNRGNNDLSNLELICPNCHYEEHYLEKSWLKDFAQQKKGRVG